MELTDQTKTLVAEVLESLPFARLMGMRLADMSENEAIVELEVRDDLRQPSGVLHGGVTATLIDTAMAFAVRTQIDIDEATATIDLNVHYLRPLISGMATCTARVVRAGKNIFTVAADVADDNGKLVATALSTYTRIRK